MARVHLNTRTIIPRHEKSTVRHSPHSEVKSYYLSEEELAYYRSLPVQETRRAIILRKRPETVNEQANEAR